MTYTNIEEMRAVCEESTSMTVQLEVRHPEEVWC